jgi:hypothetical protein
LGSKKIGQLSICDGEKDLQLLPIIIFKKFSGNKIFNNKN